MYSPETQYNLYEILQKADAGDLDACSSAVSIMAVEGYLEDAAEDILDRYVLYLRRMAESGKAEAYIMLGDAYCKGQGVEQDVSKAISWYEKAVEAGIRFGNECIGMMYFEGKDVEADYEKAYRYFTKTGGKKSFCTTYSLGEMYRLGLYVMRDEEKACRYYADIVYDDRKYAEYDSYYWCACYRLGRAMHYGTGVDKDIEKSLELLAKAKHKADDEPKGFELANITPQEVQEEWILLNQDAGRF